jgi:Tol biopolymer transport system component
VLDWQLARTPRMSQVEPRVSASEPSASVVRAQLSRILSSELFSRSDRLSAFLRFIVERTLGGEGDTLKEQVIAVELYGKAPDFSTAADPIVRVDARRLRDRLREYYAAAPHDAVLISVPKGSYTPVFEINPLTEAPLGAATLPGIHAVSSAGAATEVSRVGVPIESRPRLLRRLLAVAAAVLLIGAMAWFVIRIGVPSKPPPVRLLTLTSFPGSEGGPPAFSPDGNFVVFAWSGPDFTASGDLWVKAVDGEALRRLTDTPRANEVYPAWSPDGRQIAFNRSEGRETLSVHVMSALGGAEQKVADRGVRPTWLPDSRSLVFHDRVAGSLAPVHYVLATGERRQLTTPPAGFFDVLPKVSPDGTMVAFVRSTRGLLTLFGGTTMAAPFVVPMAGGDPVQLDDWVRTVGGPEWTPDSREIFYPRWEASGVRPFRVAATGRPAAPVAGLPTDTYMLSISGYRPGGTFRIAVVDARSDVGLRMIDLEAPRSGERLSAWTAFCDSTRLDWPGRFSRDGAQVSFTSDRSGIAQILVANRDGSQMRTLTAFEGISIGLASWSPDGRSLVFDAIDDKNITDLFVVGANGGPLRRLTHDDNREIYPEWSRDGKWIYYASDVSDRSEIWRIPAKGGPPVKLTQQGGWDPRESPDGRAVYFLEPLDDPRVATTLKRVGIDGGNVSPVLNGVRQGGWDIADTGIVFVTGGPGMARDPTRPDALEFYSFKDGRTRRLGELPFPVTSRGYSPPRVLAVSPDGRWVVVSHMDDWTRDIVVADNFR